MTAVAIVLALLLIVAFLRQGRIERQLREQRQENAELGAANQRRAREDLSRMRVLRDALDEANGHFEDWAGELDDAGSGGEPS